MIALTPDSSGLGRLLDRHPHWQASGQVRQVPDGAGQGLELQAQRGLLLRTPTRSRVTPFTVRGTEVEYRWVVAFAGRAKLLVALAIAVGLSGPAIAAEHQGDDSDVPAVAAIDGPTPTSLGVVPIVRACDRDLSSRAERASAAHVLCELDEPLEIHPVVLGPRHRGAVSYPRVAEEITTELDELQRFDGGPLRACYRWARWTQPDLAGDVPMGLSIDEWGRIDRVTADAPAVGSDLSACLSRTLTGMSVGSYTPRRTFLTVVFRLLPSGQTRPKRRPARPALRPRAATGQRVCVEQPAVLPIDRLDESTAIVVVDDFSEEQDQEERRERYRAEKRAWIAGGRRGPEPKMVPDVIPCYARVRGKPNRPDVAASISFQRGDFEACYAEATARGHGGASEVALVAFVNRAGQFERTRAQSSTTGEAKLDSCLADALAHAHVATGLGGIFEVHVPLRLSPAAHGVASVATDAEEMAGDALDQGDGQTAWGRYRNALAATPAPRRCAVTVGLLQAALTAAPWQEDERVSAAVEELREAMRAVPQSEVATCQKLALPILTPWVARPFDLGGATRRPAIDVRAAARMQRLLSFEPPLPVSGLLRVLRSEALLRSSRWLEAADGFLAAAGARDLPADWTEEAADSAAWAYARAMFEPQPLGQLESSLRLGPTPELRARHPDIDGRLRAALALRHPKDGQADLPWEHGFNRGHRASTTERLARLAAVPADPVVTAMEPRNARIFLRSLRIAGRTDLVCREARRLLVATRSGTDADRARLQGFLQSCRPGRDGDAPPP